MPPLDWSALIKPLDDAAKSNEDACNPEAVVTDAYAVTHQAVEYKGQSGTCNHVTTKTTKTEERGGSPISEADHLPGGECCGDVRASIHTQGQSLARPSLPYRLRDTRNNAGLVIGELGDTLADLLHDLTQRYGERLDLNSIREAFEERAAIMEFDAGMSRSDAEQAAADELRRPKTGT